MIDFIHNEILNNPTVILDLYMSFARLSCTRKRLDPLRLHIDIWRWIHITRGSSAIATMRHGE